LETVRLTAGSLQRQEGLELSVLIDPLTPVKVVFLPELNPALFLLKLLDVIRGAVWPNDDDELPESSSAHKKNPQPLSLFGHL